jgi:hypothetical protein
MPELRYYKDSIDGSLKKGAVSKKEVARHMHEYLLMIS